VGLRSEVENGINLVALEAVHDFGGVCDVAMVECEIALVVEGAGVVQRSAVVELVEGDDIVCIGVGQGKVSYQPTCAAIVKNVLEYRWRKESAQVPAYMNPAPPVIIIFLTSGNGSYFVLPVKTGASFHTPKSSKNLFAAG